MDDKIIKYYDSRDFKILKIIDSGGSALVYAACWKDTAIYAIKKFNENSKKGIINEVCYWYNFI